MPFATGARSYLAFIPETTFGVTPATPQLIRLPIVSHSLNLKKTLVQSAEITPDRQVRVSRHGNRNVAGDIVVEFCGDDYDALLEAALFGAFASGTLKCGTTFKSFTMEDGMTDITKYRKFLGMAVSSLAIDLKPNAMVMLTFTMVGKDGPAATATPLDSVLTEPSGNPPFDSFSGTITEGGVAIATITALNLKIENSLQPTAVIGSPTAPQLEYGRARVTGQVQAYFDDITLYNKYVNETASSLVFSVTGGGDTYTFNLPNVKLNSGDVPLENEQSRMLTMDIEALYNAGITSTMSIVKS